MGVNNLSEAGLEPVAAAEAELTGCPEALALCPNKAALEGEAEVATAALKAPKAGSGVVLAEFTAEALPKPEKPEVPKPPAVAAVLKEKEAADGAAGLPNPRDWGALGEDVAPNAGAFPAAEELPAAGLLPDDAELTRLELVLKEKLLALVLLLLLLTGKPASREFIKNTRNGYPRDTKPLLHFKDAAAAAANYRKCFSVLVLRAGTYLTAQSLRFAVLPFQRQVLVECPCS